ncbi:MAG: PKD domain-containing protein [Bacteroidetes bacterium]|nr:PKD domain-containing protein [Bacteroidota bacterium]
MDVYTGSCGSLVSVGCNDDGASCGLESEYTWVSVIGTVYYIRVHGFLGDVGNYQMDISCVGGPTTWIGNNNNWYDPSNWSTNTVPTLCADNVLIPSSPTGGSFPIISGANPATTVGNLIMDNNAQLSLSGQTLTVCNNFIGGLGSGANVVAVTGGALIMGGSAAQNIAGNSSVDVLYIANASNTIAVQSGASVRVNEELRLSAGTFDNSAGGNVILGSTASRTANLNNFCGGCVGTYTGPVTAERFIQGVSGTTYNQHHIGSPVNTVPVAALADDLNGGLYGANNVFVTPTPTCNPDFLDQNSNYGNVFEWEETGPAGNGVFPNSCYQAGFKVRSSGNLDNGVGYVVNSPAANVLDVTGTPNTGDITVSGLTNSNYTNSAVNNFVTQSGWNELANPYPSSVSLAAQAGIDPGIAIWHTSGEYTGTFQPSILGANADLAPWQGFWARVTNPQTSPSFSFLQSQRKTDQNVYYMTMGANTLLMKAKGFGFADATYVKFDANATPAYDLGYDVEKILGGHKQPRLFTYQSAMPDTRLAVNAIADGAQNNTVPMQLLPGQSGTLTLEAHGVSSFDPTQYIFLEDKVTGTMQDLRSNANYTFSMNVAENPDRFVLHFTPAAQFSTTDASCNTPGTIDVVQPGDASWSYAITDANYNMIGSGMLDNAHPVSVAAPAAGVYTITMVDNNGYVVVKNITINGISAALAGFTPSAALVSTNEDVTFTSSSANATSYVWEFGDGSMITGVANPTYSYPTEGTYVVTLTVTSPDGCVSTSSSTIVVSKVSSVANVVNQPITTWSAGNKSVC